MSFGDNAQFAGGPPDSRRKQNVELLSCWSTVEKSKVGLPASPATSAAAPLAYIF